MVGMQSGKGKVAIQGAAQRSGQVVAGATNYTNGAYHYGGLGSTYNHSSVIHNARQYVNGGVHTNTIESFWNPYQRAWKDTYTYNARKHTDRYISERTFAYNHRWNPPLERATEVVSGVAGKRLTYTSLKADV